MNSSRRASSLCSSSNSEALRLDSPSACKTSSSSVMRTTSSTRFTLSFPARFLDLAIVHLPLGRLLPLRAAQRAPDRQRSGTCRSRFKPSPSRVGPISASRVTPGDRARAPRGILDRPMTPLDDPHQRAVAERVLNEEDTARRHLVVHLSGAHAYGFPSPDSDLDL